MSSTAPSFRLMLLLLANFLVPCSLVLFAVGFFPYKPFLPGLAKHAELPDGHPPAAPFDKVIFMVVDALRSDFVYGHDSGFTFTQSLISRGFALPFTAHAQAPTVTMPRVKAITTGSIPSFLDMILNIAESDTTSSLANQDTWLAQIKAKDSGKLIMYGDDTWLKLFPGVFSRSEGTSSFFVSDFTEVDNNVTRHIPHELEQSDWSAMVLHFLGMDHIGHKSGPQSVNMIPKQQEMDGIVKMIYTAIENKPHLGRTLLVLCGDHGMNDGGNHGGSAPGETSPALIFMSPHFSSISNGLLCPTDPARDLEYYRIVEQSDIAPTLAALLGFPTPRNNLGVFISSLLPMWSKVEDRVKVALLNAFQILDVVRSSFTSLDFDSDATHYDCKTSLTSGLTLWCKWKDIERRLGDKLNSEQTEALQRSLEEFSRNAQQVLSSTASNYDLDRMMQGIILSAIAALLALFAFPSGARSLVSVNGVFFTASTLLYCILFFGSSYVEEEQQFWYWLSAAWIQLQCLRMTPKSWKFPILLLICHRTIRRWNQSGQKFQGAPDIVTTFLTENPTALWAGVLLAYAELTNAIHRYTLRPTGVPTAVSALLALAVTGSSLFFKLCFTQADAPELVELAQLPSNLVTLARVHFFIVACICVYVIMLRGMRGWPQEHAHLGPVFACLLATQSKAVNIPLIFFIRSQQRGLEKLKISTLSHFVGSLLLGQSSLFAFGNTNSISSIDLSQAYNGLSSFNAVLVGIQLVGTVFTGPFILLASGTQLRSKTESNSDGRARHWYTWTAASTFSISLAVLAVEGACFWLREHLFVWTVFSPKFLYVVAWWAAVHLIGVIGLRWVL